MYLSYSFLQTKQFLPHQKLHEITHTNIDQLLKDISKPSKSSSHHVPLYTMLSLKTNYSHLSFDIFCRIVRVWVASWLDKSLGPSSRPLKKKLAFEQPVNFRVRVASHLGKAWVRVASVTGGASRLILGTLPFSLITTCMYIPGVPHSIFVRN